MTGLEESPFQGGLRCTSWNVQRVGSKWVTDWVEEKDNEAGISWDMLRLQEKNMANEDPIWRDLGNINGLKIYINKKSASVHDPGSQAGQRGEHLHHQRACANNMEWHHSLQ